VMDWGPVMGSGIRRHWKKAILEFSGPDLI
jgi:hypothetical protein